MTISQHKRHPLLAPVRWMGGWPYFIGLLLLIIVLISWFLWDRRQQLPVPPQAQEVTQNLSASVQTTRFIFNGSSEQLRAFYQQELPARGWRYCGTRATAGCSNMRPLNDGTDEQTEVYRRADDQRMSGPTIEVWPAQNASGALVVSIIATRGPA